MGLNKRQKIALVVLNVVLIAELGYALYLGHKDPENLTPIFLKYFFLLVIPTFIIGRIVIKRLRTKEPLITAVSEIPKPEIQPFPYPEEAFLHEAPVTLSAAQAAKIEQTTRKRKILGKAAAIFIILLLVSLLDSCFARFRQPMNVLNVLPGTSKKINGPLDEKVKSVQELMYRSSSDAIHLSLDRVYSGFWFGGVEWSGTLSICPDAEPGEYRLIVSAKIRKSEKPPVMFLINVHPDKYALRQSSKSFIMRYFSISPWWAMAFLFSITVLTSLSVFLFSKKLESLMEKVGHAEVYWMMAGVAGIEIAFGLGTKHGVRPGSRLVLFNENRQVVGTVVAHTVRETDSMATVGFDSPVKVGYFVSLTRK